MHIPTTEELKTAYQAAIKRATEKASITGCSHYVCAELYVQDGLPFIKRFYVYDMHDASAVARVYVSQSGSITVTEI